MATPSRRRGARWLRVAFGTGGVEDYSGAVGAGQREQPAKGRIDGLLAIEVPPQGRVGSEQALELGPGAGVKRAVEVGLEPVVNLSPVVLAHACPPTAPVQPAKCGDSRSRSALRVRCTWLIAVPSGMPSSREISEY